jgi:hypothetical protein
MVRLFEGYGDVLHRYRDVVSITKCLRIESMIYVRVVEE